MSRSPLSYPLNRGMDAEAGGAADLQTDVMRFMAIISLCLVAIFALVQSIPLAPPIVADAPEREAEVQTPPPQAAIPELARPEQEAIEPEPIPDAVPTPAPEPPAVPPPAPQTVADAPTQEGFTLRFADDLALTRLVASDRVRMFAVANDQALRMEVRNGQVRFSSSDAPQRMHEMDLATVPQSVVSALRRSGSLPPAAVRWGVTLPPAMSRQLDLILSERSGGNLVIDADGTLRVES
jgi:hypothetical protein